MIKETSEGSFSASAVTGLGPADTPSNLSILALTSGRIGIKKSQAWDLIQAPRSSRTKILDAYPTNYQLVQKYSISFFQDQQSSARGITKYPHSSRMLRNVLATVIKISTLSSDLHQTKGERRYGLMIIALYSFQTFWAAWGVIKNSRKRRKEEQALLCASHIDLIFVH